MKLSGFTQKRYEAEWVYSEIKYESEEVKFQEDLTRRVNTRRRRCNPQEALILDK